MTDAPLLEIRNVKKYYPIRKTRNGTDLAVKAVDQVSLTVNQGECSFSYRLQIWQPRKPYKPLKALTWLECP